MDEYIKRSAAVQCARDVANDFKNEGFVEEAGAADTVGDWLQSIHAADVRPVVLCRDCVHARRYTNKIKCGYWSEQTASEIVCEDDFCSYGEKREES